MASSSAQVSKGLTVTRHHLQDFLDTEKTLSKNCSILSSVLADNIQKLNPKDQAVCKHLIQMLDHVATGYGLWLGKLGATLVDKEGKIITQRVDGQDDENETVAKVLLQLNTLLAEKMTPGTGMSAYMSNLILFGLYHSMFNQLFNDNSKKTLFKKETFLDKVNDGLKAKGLLVDAQSVIINPVQRFPRFRLLIQDAVKPLGDSSDQNTIILNAKSILRKLERIGGLLIEYMKYSLDSHKSDYNIIFLDASRQLQQEFERDLTVAVEQTLDLSSLLKEEDQKNIDATFAPFEQLEVKAKMNELLTLEEAQKRRVTVLLEGLDSTSPSSSKTTNNKRREIAGLLVNIQHSSDVIIQRVKFSMDKPFSQAVGELNWMFVSNDYFNYMRDLLSLTVKCDQQTFKAFNRVKVDYNFQTAQDVLQASALHVTRPPLVFNELARAIRNYIAANPDADQDGVLRLNADSMARKAARFAALFNSYVAKAQSGEVDIEQLLADFNDDMIATAMQSIIGLPQPGASQSEPDEELDDVDASVVNFISTIKLPTAHENIDYNQLPSISSSSMPVDDITQQPEETTDQTFNTLLAAEEEDPVLTEINQHAVQQQTSEVIPLSVEPPALPPRSKLASELFHSSEEPVLPSSSGSILSQEAPPLPPRSGNQNAHNTIMLPRPHDYHYTSRWHFFTVDAGHANRRNFITQVDRTKVGDALKHAIMSQIANLLATNQDRSNLVTQIRGSAEYQILKTGQGLFSRIFGRKTDSLRALERLIPELKEEAVQTKENNTFG